MAWAQNLLGLCLFGCAPDAAFLGFAWWLKFRFAWWLKFRSGWGTIPLFLGVPKATFRDFWGCSSAMGLDGKPAGALPFRTRSRRSFLRLCLVAEVSQWLGHDFIVFRGSKRNVSRFLRLQFRNGLDARPAGALPFRMRSGRSFLRLCLVAEVSQLLGSFLSLCLITEVSQWLGHDSIVFRGSKKQRFEIFEVAVPQWLGRKTCLGLCLYRMPSRRSFLRLCLLAEVSQWLGHDFIVFRGSKRKRFEIFEVAVPQWLGRKTCWGSAFSDALPTHLS